MSGRVTVVLTQPKPYAVTFKATNAKSYDTATGNLVVDPLPDGSVGSFTGYIARNDLMPGNDGLGAGLWTSPRQRGKHHRHIDSWRHFLPLLGIAERHP